MRTPKRDQLSLNSDHTHFIIIREQTIASQLTTDSEEKTVKHDATSKQIENFPDSAKNATNKFRDNFEAFLHEEISQAASQATGMYSF